MDSWTVIEPLYAAHFTNLVRGIERKLSRAEAEDIVQSAFIELRGKAETGRVRNPKALLERILEQRVKDHKRDEFYELADGLNPEPFVKPLADTIGRGIMAHELVDALMELPELEQAAYILIELRGLTSLEAAEWYNRNRRWDEQLSAWTFRRLKCKAFVSLAHKLGGSRDEVKRRKTCA